MQKVINSFMDPSSSSINHEDFPPIHHDSSKSLKVSSAEVFSRAKVDRVLHLLWLLLELIVLL